MDWKNIVGSVGSIAASVAPLLGGPIGLAVSIGSQIAGALGTDNTPDAVLAELKANPEAALKLQQWAHEEKAQIREANIELQRLALQREQANLADTQKAREENKGHWMPAVLSIFLFMLFSTVSFALFKWAIPDGNRDLIVYLAGQISGFVATVVVYWLGASKGGEEQTKFINKQNQNINATKDNSVWKTGY